MESVGLVRLVHESIEKGVESVLPVPPDDQLTAEFHELANVLLLSETLVHPFERGAVEPRRFSGVVSNGGLN
jgi:hypothetical protein